MRFLISDFWPLTSCRGPIESLHLPKHRICGTLGPSLHSKLSSRILRTVITTMTLLGWFVLSNHCALGGMAPSGPAKDEHACCRNNSTPSPAHAPSDSQQGAECCKAVHALVPDGIKAGDLKPADFVVAILLALPMEVIRPARRPVL